MVGKLAIIASGGGLTCSYSVGSILALVDKYKLANPDIVIGGSGGAGTMAYYVARQYQSIRNIWENLLCTPKFLCPWRWWRVMDIDYLIDQVFKKQDPLNVQNISRSITNFLIPLTNADTGKVEYFSNRDKVDIFELLRATKAMPLAYGKIITINGNHYCDTFLSAGINASIQKAKELGATKIIALDNSTDNPVVANGLKAWRLTRSREFRQNYEVGIKELGQVKYGKEVFFLHPKHKLCISTLCNDKSKLKQAIEQGYQEIIKNQELKEFINQG